VEVASGDASRRFVVLCQIFALDLRAQPTSGEKKIGPGRNRLPGPCVLGFNEVADSVAGGFNPGAGNSPDN
jgi:hypothetical protein